MKLVGFACSIVALLAGPAAAQTPGWCSAIGNNRVDASGELKRILEDDDPRNALKDLVGASCKPDGEQREHMKEIVAARDKWSKRLELTEADWADVADYATLGQGERMNHTIKEATVKRFHYESHDQLRTHLDAFMAAYNFARRPKTLSGLTPYEYIAEIWTSEANRFIVDPIHQMPGLNT